MQSPALPRRSWRWFFPASRVAWIVWSLWAALVAFFIAIIASDGNFDVGAYFVIFGSLYLALGFVQPWLPILGRSGRRLNRLPGFTERLQDARGRGTAVVASSVIVGSVIGMLFASLV